MSDVLVNQPGSTDPTMDISGTGKVPFGRLVAVELRKAYDTRAGFWLIASMGILTVGIFAIMLLVAAFTDTEFAYGMFVQGAAFGTGVLLPVLGILLVTSEWSQRTAMTTFSLVPNRVEVLLAKASVGFILTVVVAVFALVAGALANLINGVIIGGADWDLGWRFFVAFLITQILAMLTGFGFAVLLLNSPAAIVAFFAYMFLVPTIFGVGGALVGWIADLTPWVEFQTAQAPLFGGDFEGGSGAEPLALSGKEVAQLFTSGAIWLGLPLVLGSLRVLRSEVK